MDPGGLVTTVRIHQGSCLDTWTQKEYLSYLHPTRVRGVLSLPVVTATAVHAVFLLVVTTLCVTV